MYLYCGTTPLNKQVHHDFKLGCTRNIHKRLQSYKTPLDFQRQLVDRLEKLQLQIDALEEYQAQTEDNAKFMLESYLGSTS